ncbi:MAG: NADPH:quinone reductase [Limnohabitans sp.]
MKAVWYSQQGPAQDVLQFGELPTPSAGPGQVRVRLLTSGVNPSDVKSRRARPVTDPLIVPHSDGAGFIDQVGEGVAAARLGEPVWTWNAQWQRPMGTAAEYVVLPASQAVRLPEGTDFAAGACLGIPALTAVQALVWAERLAGALHGRQVLVVGAASSVGHYITQLLHQGGAQVLGTVGSPERAAHAQAAGLHAPIFYKQENVAERVRELTRGQGVDAIIDMDFSGTASWAPEVLKPHGAVVCYGSNALEQSFQYRPWLFASLGVKFFLVYDLSPADRQAALARLTDLLGRGALQHGIGPHFSLAQTVQAHQAVEAGQAIGNVVIDIAPA